MSQAPAMPLFCDAYLADTMHLTLEEHGAYLKLLMIIWRNNGAPLPDDDARLAQMLNVPLPRWRNKLRPILAGFFDLSQGTWRQKRLEKEWIFLRKKLEKNRENGAKGGRPNPLKNINTEKPSGSSWDNPNRTQTESTHTHTQDIGSSGGSAGARENLTSESATVLANLPSSSTATNRATVPNPLLPSVAPSPEAESLVRAFERLRDELWPNNPNFPTPRLTLLTRAQDYLDQGAPLALATEVIERGMRTAAAQGKPPTGSLKAFHLSMANAIANHKNALVPLEGGPSHARPHRSPVPQASLAERERRDRAAIFTALAGELELNRPGPGFVDG